MAKEPGENSGDSYIDPEAESNRVKPSIREVIAFDLYRKSFLQIRDEGIVLEPGEKVRFGEDDEKSKVFTQALAEMQIEYKQKKLMGVEYMSWAAISLELALEQIPGTGKVAKKLKTEFEKKFNTLRGVEMQYEKNGVDIEQLIDLLRYAEFKKDQTILLEFKTKDQKMAQDFLDEKRDIFADYVHKLDEAIKKIQD